jgi:hypothetical protein
MLICVPFDVYLPNMAALNCLHFSATHLFTACQHVLQQLSHQLQQQSSVRASRSGGQAKAGIRLTGRLAGLPYCSNRAAIPEFQGFAVGGNAQPAVHACTPACLAVRHAPHVPGPDVNDTRAISPGIRLKLNLPTKVPPYL